MSDLKNQLFHLRNELQLRDTYTLHLLALLEVNHLVKKGKFGMDHEDTVDFENLLNKISNLFSSNALSQVTVPSYELKDAWSSSTMFNTNEPKKTKKQTGKYKKQLPKDPKQTLVRDDPVNWLCIGLWVRYLIKTASDFVERAAELQYILEGTLPTNEESRNLFDRVFLNSMFEKQTDTIKYWINQVWCQTYNLELPEKPEGIAGADSVFTHATIKWIQMKKGPNHRWRAQITSGFCTIFMGFKKALLPLSPLKVLKSAVKHSATLSKEAAVLPEWLLDDMEQKLKTLLYGWDVPQIDQCQTESKSAAFDNTRSSGGSLKFMMNLYDKINGRDISKFTDDGQYIHCFKEQQFVGFADTWAEGKGPEVRLVRAAYPDFRVMLMETIGFKPENRVRPAFILEPLKVRTVTLSDSLGQRFFSSVQQSLWKFMKEQPMFALIGRKLSEEDIQGLFEKMTENEYALSGDFQAATDNLNSYLSNLVLDLMATKLARKNKNDQVLIDYLERHKGMTTESTIVYEHRSFPKMENVDWKQKLMEVAPNLSGFTNEGEDGTWSVQQRNGQLMGSKLSFVVLCLVNYCLHWTSCEMSEGRPISHEEMKTNYKCLINGDDYLAVCDEKRYKIWEELCTLCGLAKSVGKNFFSKDLCQVNSTTYSLQRKTTVNPESNETTTKIITRLIPFVNFGLLHGRGKGMDENVDSYPRGRHSRFTSLLDTSEKSIDEYSRQETSLCDTFQDLMRNVPHALANRTKDLWDIQLSFLKKILDDDFDVKIILPGEKGWNPHCDELRFITPSSSANENRKQFKLAEHTFAVESGMSVRSRRDRAFMLQEDRHLFVDPLLGFNIPELNFFTEDLGFYPQGYFWWSEIWEKERIDKESKERALGICLTTFEY